MKISVKPLSVNRAWQGRRFKTQEYKDYEQEVLLLLPPLTLPESPYSIYLEFGLSNIQSDWDNPIKPFVDILQKKYWFNDREIFEAVVKKVKVPKGEEYIVFDIKTLEG